MQQFVLNAFKKVLLLSPVSLEVFREERIWDLVFSENFFYFEQTAEEFSEDCLLYNEGTFSSSMNSNTRVKTSVVEILQMEVISFVELAATSNGSVHNVVCFL